MYTNYSQEAKRWKHLNTEFPARRAQKSMGEKEMGLTTRPTAREKQVWSDKPVGRPGCPSSKQAACEGFACLLVLE